MQNNFYNQSPIISLCYRMLSVIILMAAITINGNAAPKQLSELPSHYVTIHDSVKVHYKVWDHETPHAPLQTICFVHGFGCDMNTWEKQYEGLRNEAGLRLVFIDLPGYGKSDKPHTTYDLPLFVHAVDGVLNNLHVTPAIFVGHSLGTPVCRQTLLSTMHISGLVDIDGVYCFYDNATPEYLKAVEQFGASFDGPQCSEVIKGFVQSLAGPDTPAWITNYAMKMMPQTPEYVASSTMHNLIDRKYWPQFALPLDVEIICTQNSGLESDNRQKMAALYPQMNYTELTTCGHFIHMEQPEMVNQKLKEYAAKIKANGVEDYDFAIRNLEENYAGFRFKVNDKNRDEWNRIKHQLRDSAATAAYSAPELISDLCCWFKDHHLSCTYRNYSTRFPFSKADYGKMITAYAPKQLSTRVNDDTWLLRFPTWFGDEAYEKWVADAVEQYRQSGCSKLIVDLRGNGGGNDGQYAPLLNLLYAQPGITDGMMLRNTKDNRDRCLELAGDSQWWKDLMDKCAADTAAYVTIMDDNTIEKQVDAHRPKQTAVIIDQRVASSSEQLLLELRAVAPDVKFYGRDNTMGCIDVSNVRITRLPHAPNALRIPVTVSKRLTEGRTVIDGAGIAPDVKIKLPLPDTLTDNIDSWVLWVADHMPT